MRRFPLGLIFALLVFGLAPQGWGRAKLEPLPIPKLAQMKKKSCTLIHVWATWCSICIQEMPALLKLFAGMKQIHPVVLDVSQPMAQQSFSIPWMTKLNPPFKVYYKPPALPDDVYGKAIDPEWSGALPYSAMYDKGKKKKVWVGEVSTEVLAKEMAEQCK